MKSTKELIESGKNSEQIVNALMNEGASVHYNPKRAEPLFKRIGLDVPKHPKEGDVYYKGRKVGYVSNFNGLMIDSREVIELLQDYAEEYDLGIWNPNQTTMESRMNEMEQDKFRVIDVAAQYTSENLEQYLSQRSWDAEQLAKAIAQDVIPQSKQDEFIKNALGKS